MDAGASAAWWVRRTLRHNERDKTITDRRPISMRQYESHPRGWHDNYYVYPVISRRSGGLSLGINLNPDAACNFDCIYCQVDRTGSPQVRDVDPDRLRNELISLVDSATSGALFEDPAFADVPKPLRTIKDLAFSGDGEPTTCTLFGECVKIVTSVKRDTGITDTKMVLITDACYLTRPAVEETLLLFDQNNGEIWTKLDAGTEAYYQKINRPNFPLIHVIENIIAASRVRPVVIQSLFMQVDGEGPSDFEIAAFTDRLNEITDAGGKIDHVQVYTVARRPAQSTVTALDRAEVDRITALVRSACGLVADSFYGPD